MEKVLWVAEKKTQLTEGIFPVLPGVNEDEGKGWVRRGGHWFVWLDGHALQLATPDTYLPDDIPRTAKGRKVWRQQDLPIIPASSQWKLVADPRKQPRLSKLKELLRWCDVVHHLGDPDPEGQLLVDEVLEFYGCHRPVKRVLINDYNRSKVQESLANVRDNQESVFRGWSLWAQARSRYDWLVGMNGTRAMTLRGQVQGMNGVLPVGSVQTPLLYIVRERDRVIENFKPEPYLTLSAVFSHANGSFKARWKPRENQAGLDEQGRLIDGELGGILVKRLQGQPGQLSKYQVAEKAKKPPLPLSMNELQLEGFSRYGYTAQEVIDAAQVLYDTYKVATYPRTDVRYLSEAHHSEAGAVISAIGVISPELSPLMGDLDPLKKSAAFDDKRMKTPTGEPTPHHAIIPTIPESPVDSASWTPCERNVFDMIARAYLAQFAADFIFKATEVHVLVEGETFTASGTTPVSPGWTAIYTEPAPVDGVEPEVDPDANQKLPEMAQADEVDCLSCEQTNRMTAPPPRFDDNMLLDAMKNVHRYVPDEELRKRLKEGQGIGTQATRGPMIAEMKCRELFIPVPKGGKKKLMTSPAARNLIDALPLSVKEPTQAGLFKSALDQVAGGELSMAAFMAQTEEFVRTIVSNANTVEMAVSPIEAATDVPCPVCKGSMVVSHAKHTCSNCTFELKHTIAGRALSDTEIQTLLTKHATRELKGFFSKAKNKKFAARLVVNKETQKVEFSFEQSPTPASVAAATTPASLTSKCPKCSEPLEYKTRVFACSSSSCNFQLWTEIKGRAMKPAELDTLLRDGVTPVLSGFTSNQRKFSAKLRLNQADWSVKFEFEARA